MVLFKQKKVSEKILRTILSNEYLHLSNYENIKNNLSKSKFKFIESYKNNPIIDNTKKRKHNLRINKKCSIEPLVKGISFVYRINSGIYT